MGLISSLLPKKNTAEGEKPKRDRPLLRFMFNPELGGLVRSINDVFNLFIQLIAYIFVVGQLLPSTHPVLKGEIKGVKAIGAMLVDASGKLEFKWSRIHQFLLFYAVVGLLLFGAMFIISAIFHLFVGMAHAQGAAGGADTSMFLASKDRAGEWLKCVFPMNYGENGAIPCDVPEGRAIFMLATAIADMLAFYAKGCLVLAGIIVGYTAVSIVVEAAHEGVFFGKRHNELWTPIRLVWALLLLVPLPPHGFSLGQVVIVKVAGWGSGMATNAWDVFANAAKDSNYNAFAAMSDSPSVRSQALSTIQSALAAETCIQSLWLSDNPGRNIQDPGEFWGTTDHGDDLIFEGEWSFPTNNFLCGTVKFDGQTNVDEGFLQRGMNTVTSSAAAESQKQALRKAAYRGNTKAFLKVLPDIRKLAFRIAKNRIDVSSKDYHDPEHAMPPATDYATIVHTFIEARSGTILAEVQNLKNTQEQRKLLEHTGDFGWIGAGGWMMQISQITGVAAQTVSSMISATLLPNGLAAQGVLSMDDQYGNGSPERVMLGVVQETVSWSMAAEAKAINTQQGISSSANAGADNLEGALSSRFYIIKAMMNHLGGNGDPFTAATGLGWALIYMAIAAMIGAVATNTAVAVLDAIDTASNVAIVSGVATGGTTTVVGGVVKGGAKLVKWGIQALGPAGSKVLSFIGLAVLIPGIVLAIYLPLLPTLRFLFAFLAWFLAVLEAVFAVPVVALAHLRTDGAGLAGPMGLKSYMFLLQIFVRPVLIICGLVGSLLVFNVTVRVINLLFLLAIGNYVSTSGYMAGFVFSLGAIIIYTAMLYTLANMSFKLIDKIPDDILKWIGQSGIAYGLDANIGSAYRTTQTMGGSAHKAVETGAGSAQKSIGGRIAGGAKMQRQENIAEGVVGGALGGGAAAAAIGEISERMNDPADGGINSNTNPGGDVPKIPGGGDA